MPVTETKVRAPARVLAAACKIACVGVSARSLDCIEISADPAGSAVVSTDGKRLIRWTDTPDTDPGNPILVNAGDMLSAVKGAKPEDEYTFNGAIHRHERSKGGHVSEAASAVYPLRPTEGGYVNWRRVIPGGNPRATVTVDAKLLAELLGAIARATPETQGAVRVELVVYGENEPIKLVAKSGSETTLGLIMPTVK